MISKTSNYDFKNIISILREGIGRLCFLCFGMPLTIILLVWIFLVLTLGYVYVGMRPLWKTGI